MLNRVWAFLAMMAIGVGFFHGLFTGGDVINAMADSLFSSAKTAFELTIGLASALILWLGIFQIAQAAGVVNWLSGVLAPVLHRLMPEVPRDHPAFGSMGLNVGMSMLGLDNGALPSGLKAMEQLQTLNPREDTASNAQQMFLVYMTTSVTLFPVSILGYRVAAGAAHPADVFLPLLIASYVGLFVGLAYMAVVQKIKLFSPGVFVTAFAFVALVASAVWAANTVSAELIGPAVTLFGNTLLLFAVFAFVAIAWFKAVPVYDTFVDGAKKGFAMAVDLLPFVIGMFVVISLLRASGSFALLQTGLEYVCTAMGFDSRWVTTVPQGILKSFSGGGARALMLDTFKTSGVDSLPGRMSAVVQGASDTTFYILAVCAGAARLKNLGAAVSGALVADIASFVTAIACTYYLFGR